MSTELLKYSINFRFDRLLSAGVCFGKFTKSGKFNLKITCLDYLAQYAIYKVWLKPQAELSFLYGNNVLKAGLGRITEDTPQYQGVVIFNMSDTPLGFGVSAKSTEGKSNKLTKECRSLQPTDICVFHQSDVGEYLREE
jgi:60S ribosome subunit biogenesis protein NIP7